MKSLLQQTMQSILNAGVAAASGPGAGESAQFQFDLYDRCVARRLRTKLGWVTVWMPVTSCFSCVTGLFSRYAASEMKFLLLLGRIIVRGRASPVTVRGMAEQMCGCQLEGACLDAVVAGIDRDVTRYIARDMERTRAAAAQQTKASVRRGERRDQGMRRISPDLRSAEV